MSLGVRLTSSAYKLGILNPVICAIRNVNGAVKTQPKELEDAIAAVMKKAVTEKQGWLERKETQGFRNLFVKMGYPKLIPAGERLLASFTGEKGWRDYGPIVNAYNIPALEYVSGIGMHDLDKCKGDLVIRRAQAGLSMVPQFKNKPEKVTPNDLVYGCEEGKEEKKFEVMAWLGKKDLDSGSHCVTDTTKNLLMVVLGNEATSAEFNQKICELAFGHIKLTSPEAEMSYLSVTRDESDTDEDGEKKIEKKFEVKGDKPKKVRAEKPKKDSQLKQETSNELKKDAGVTLIKS